MTIHGNTITITGITAVVSLFVGWFLRTLIGGSITARVNYVFTKKIEELKKLYTRELEMFRQDYSLYNKQRYDAYGELNELMLKAHGAIAQKASRLTERYTYEEFGVEDIRKMLTDLNIPSKSVELVCNKWESNREEAKEDIYKWLDKVADKRMKECIRAFNNAFLLKELYLSEEVAIKIEHILKKMFEAEVYAKSDDLEDYGGSAVLEIAQIRKGRRDKLEQILGEIEQLRADIKQTLIREMRKFDHAH